MADTTLRGDRYLARFFEELDRMVGLDNIWIALSAPGVSAAFPRSQLMTATLANNPLAHKGLNSFNTHVGGDIFLILEPFAMPVEREIGTTRLGPRNYEAQVPLILRGSRFKPGNYANPCQSIDLAPTLAAAMWISQPSGAKGHPLTQAFK